MNWQLVNQFLRQEVYRKKKKEAEYVDVKVETMPLGILENRMPENGYTRAPSLSSNWTELMREPWQ